MPRSSTPYPTPRRFALAAAVLCLGAASALPAQTWQRQHPLTAPGDAVTSIRVTEAGFDVQVENGDNALVYSLEGRTGDLRGVRAVPTEVCPGLRVIAREGALVRYVRASVDGAELLVEFVEAPQGDCRAALSVTRSYRFALPAGERNRVGTPFYDATADRVYISGVTYHESEPGQTRGRQFVIGFDVTTGTKTFERQQAELALTTYAEPLGVAGVVPGRGVYTLLNNLLWTGVSLTEFAPEGLSFDERAKSDCDTWLRTAGASSGELVALGKTCSPKVSNPPFLYRVESGAASRIQIDLPKDLGLMPGVELDAFALATGGEAVQAGSILGTAQRYAYLSRSTAGTAARWSYFVPDVQATFSHIIPTADGGAVAAGFTDGKLYVVRVDPATLVGVARAPLAGARVFPNPAREYVVIESDAVAPAEPLDIHDLTGRCVRQAALGAGGRVALEGLSAGVYAVTFPRIGGVVRVVVGE